MDLWEETAEYALHALTVRNRQDVYEAILNVMKAWDSYESDEMRRQVLRNIEHESVGNPRWTLGRNDGNLAMMGWKQERAQQMDTVTDAYVRARIP